MTPQELDREIRIAQAADRRERDALLRQDRQIDNPTSNHTDEIDRLNASHPHYETVPVHVIGVRLSNGVLDRCYVRKLNGRSNAWEGWVPVHNLQFLPQNDADAVAALRHHLQMVPQ